MADSAVDHEIEANWLEGGEADGEEEPLFADDLTDEEDDPPPLPPPMPTLGELTAGGQRVKSELKRYNSSIRSLIKPLIVL